MTLYFEWLLFSKWNLCFQNNVFVRWRYNYVFIFSTSLFATKIGASKYCSMLTIFKIFKIVTSSHKCCQIMILTHSMNNNNTWLNWKYILNYCVAFKNRLSFFRTLNKWSHNLPTMMSWSDLLADISLPLMASQLIFFVLQFEMWLAQYRLSLSHLGPLTQSNANFYDRYNDCLHGWLP